MIRWGILGAGNIAGRFAASLQQADDACLYAVSGRNEGKVKSFEEKYPCQRQYVGHANLLCDEQVDAVYIALPHGLHHEWALKAMRKGKAVLCEKPAMMNAEEMRDIAQCARETGVLFMEAMKTRFLPLYRELRKLIQEELFLGDIVRVETSQCILFPKEMWGKTYHTDPYMGGALLDCGIYAASWIEDYIEGKLLSCNVQAMVTEGIDTYVNAALQFEGAEAVLETGFDRELPKRAVLYGTKGRAEILNEHRPERAFITLNGQEPYELAVPYDHDDFYSQIIHFNQLLESGERESQIMPSAASIRCAELLDAIRQEIQR